MEMQCPICKELIRNTSICPRCGWNLDCDVTLNDTLFAVDNTFFAEYEKKVVYENKDVGQDSKEKDLANIALQLFFRRLVVSKENQDVGVREIIALKKYLEIRAVLEDAPEDVIKEIEMMNTQWMNLIEAEYRVYQTHKAEELKIQEEIARDQEIIRAIDKEIEILNELEKAAELVSMKKYQEAIETLKKIYESTNNSDVAYMLGNIYKNNMLMYSLAKNWYENAIERGSKKALFELGKMYYQGIGVSQDDNMAMQLIEEAAKQGDIEAQYWTGKLYEQGRGVRKNLGLAREWYQSAADNGNNDAEEKLKILED